MTSPQLRNRELPLHWRKRAQLELNEVPEHVSRDLEALRNLIAAEKKLVTRTDEEFLLRYLRARKFDVQKAFHMIKTYCKMRSANSTVFETARPSLLKDVFQQQLQTVLEDRDQHGRRVFVFRAGPWNPSKCSVWQIFQSNMLCLEQMSEEEETQIAGIVALVDMTGYSLWHARHVTYSYAKHVISLIQDCIPLRFKEFHFYNEPYIFTIFYTIIKPFIKEKLTKRIFFHGNSLESLHSYIPRDILPEEFGGLKAKFDNKEWYSTLVRNEKVISAQTLSWREES